MSATTITNTMPQRKQLSDQLDRLDHILDALSEGLNGAVADAAREGTRLAVRDAIVEIMTDPTLRARLHESTAPESASPLPKKPGFWARLKAKAGQVVQAVQQGGSNVADRATRQAQALAGAAKTAVRSLCWLGRLKNLALVGLGAGVAVSVVSYFTPHAVAVAMCGISGAVAATAVQVAVWTRRTFRALTVA